MRKDGLWPYHLATFLYLGLGAVVLYDRWAEVGSLFEPPQTGQPRLPLNSIGDVLAGFFAPLAFLWLFAATQLQRIELKLQREELIATRTVLDEQRAELQRAAKESNIQTDIMSKTLSATLSRNELEELSLNLYFISRKCLNHKIGTVGIVDRTGSTYYEIFGDSPKVTQIDPSTVDHVFIALHSSLFSMSQKIMLDPDTNMSPYSADQMIDLLVYIEQQISNIIALYSVSPNTLVRVKLDNLNLKATLDFTKFLIPRCSQWAT